MVCYTHFFRSIYIFYTLPADRLLRRLGAFLMAADLDSAPGYIPSDVNPADPPSRRRSLLAWLAQKRRAGRVFDSTRGYPGEGPAKRRTAP